MIRQVWRPVFEPARSFLAPMPIILSARNVWRVVRMLLPASL
jgi:hypothetical protein